MKHNYLRIKSSVTFEFRTEIPLLEANRGGEQDFINWLENIVNERAKEEAYTRLSMSDVDIQFIYKEL